MSSQGPKVTHMRGLLLVKSVDNLRAAGLFERYAEGLDPTYKHQVLFTLASSWVPIEICDAHYAACDRMGLADSEIDRLGGLMSEGIAGTLMSAMLKATRRAGGESYWAALKQCGRIWDRSFLGGGVTLLQAGPKDSLLEHHGLSLVKSRYWCVAARAFWASVAEMTSRKAYVKIVPPHKPDPNSIAFAGSWV